jgi:hypothetical protein
VQGYLFSRPLTPSDARAFLMNNIEKVDASIAERAKGKVS